MVLKGTKGMFQDRSHHGESNKGGEKLEGNNGERLIMRGDGEVEYKDPSSGGGEKEGAALRGDQPHAFTSAQRYLSILHSYLFDSQGCLSESREP